MENKLWNVRSAHGLTDREIGRCIYRLQKEGSPYMETELQKDGSVADDAYEVALNPYLRFARIFAPLLEDSAFCESQEGNLLFHETAQLLSVVDRISGADRDTFVKRQMEDEIRGGCYGSMAADLMCTLTTQEKSALLDYLLQLYRGRGEPYPFIGAVLLLFPQSLVFRERQKPDVLYICLDTAENETQAARFETVKMLLLPMGTTVRLSWQQPFVLTDISELEQYGNTLV